MIQFNQIYKTYRDGTGAVRDFSLQIEEGEFVTLIGPSGCGKTTTLKMINRLIDPTSGSIYINNKNINDYNIHQLRWNIGYVLQEIALFPHMTIEENISIVPEMKKWSHRKVRNRNRELLEMVGLDPSVYSGRLPSELSGGEQQRVGVIRALAGDPDIILMDEPFSALDPISREQLQQDVKTLQKEIKKTIVFVTHDMDEAMTLGDKVCLMKDGQMIQYDQPQNLLLQPKNHFVAEFIGDKKSPWQTPVENIANQTEQKVISKDNLKQSDYPSKGQWVIKDKDGYFLSVIDQGRKIKAETLSHHKTLLEATDILKTSDQYIYPVLKEGKLMGTLTYQDVIEYLKNKTNGCGTVQNE